MSEEEDWEEMGLVSGYGQRALTKEEKIRMEMAEAQEAIRTVEDSPRPSNSPAAQVKAALYTDVPLPKNILGGPVEDSIDFLFAKASRMPSYNRPAQERLLRGWSYISDACESDQLFSASRTMLARRILENESQVSRVDVRDIGTSGIGAIAIQSVRQDYKVSTTSNTQPTSIFDGILGRKKKEQ